jgi:hypothetical protein
VEPRWECKEVASVSINCVSRGNCFSKCVCVSKPLRTHSSTHSVSINCGSRGNCFSKVLCMYYQEVVLYIYCKEVVRYIYCNVKRWHLYTLTVLVAITICMYCIYTYPVQILLQFCFKIDLIVNFFVICFLNQYIYLQHLCLYLLLHQIIFFVNHENFINSFVIY